MQTHINSSQEHIKPHGQNRTQIDWIGDCQYSTSNRKKNCGYRSMCAIEYTARAPFIHGNVAVVLFSASSPNIMMIVVVGWPHQKTEKHLRPKQNHISSRSTMNQISAWERWNAKISTIRTEHKNVGWIRANKSRFGLLGLACKVNPIHTNNWHIQSRSVTATSQQQLRLTIGHHHTHTHIDVSSSSAFGAVPQNGLTIENSIASIFHSSCTDECSWFVSQCIYCINTL